MTNLILLAALTLFAQDPCVKAHEIASPRSLTEVGTFTHPRLEHPVKVYEGSRTQLNGRGLAFLCLGLACVDATRALIMEFGTPSDFLSLLLSQSLAGTGLFVLARTPKRVATTTAIDLDWIEKQGANKTQLLLTSPDPKALIQELRDLGFEQAPTSSSTSKLPAFR